MLSGFVRKTQSHVARMQRVVAPSFSRRLISNCPKPFGEPTLDYAPGSLERAQLQSALSSVRSTIVDVPVVVGDQEYFTGDIVEQVIPSDHQHVIARIHQAKPEHIKQAIELSQQVRPQWADLPIEHRMSVMLRTADRLITPQNRMRMNAVTMLGTGKNIRQAEIDCITEQADFLRINSVYLEEIYRMQPPLHSKGSWNRVEYRNLEGFVGTISPFNFAAIGTNLNIAPALMGNVTLWKPSNTAALENYVSFQLLREAGLPPGVINFIPCSAETYQDHVISSKELSGIHFTGSTKTFQTIWKHVAKNLESYKTFPRLVGETGGKNFHFVLPSAMPDRVSVLNQTIRSAFEYQGQKCSAASRMYVPRSIWESKMEEGGAYSGMSFKDTFVAMADELKMGQPDDFKTFVSAVIDDKAFNRINAALQRVQSGSKNGQGSSQILTSRLPDNSQGYFIPPTIIETKDPHSETMREELFGPVLTVYVYDDLSVGKDQHSMTSLLNNMCDLIDTTTSYGLTGAIFGNNQLELQLCERRLKYACGNMYLNDKSTGAVVGEQPFGGGRMSGTNDKAGSHLNLLRWTSPLAIKESGTTLSSYSYPHMQ